MGKDPPTTTPAELESRGLRLLSPLVPKEVWAAGVTYGLSRDERQKESSLPEVYARVFRSERPEVFFKATAERCVGPFDAIGIRGDSNWNVPRSRIGFCPLPGRDRWLYRRQRRQQSFDRRGEPTLSTPRRRSTTGAAPSVLVSYPRPRYPIPTNSPSDARSSGKKTRSFRDRPQPPKWCAPAKSWRES